MCAILTVNWGWCSNLW